ncbi:MAG: DUF1778 domain-containing protein [Planctomycetota bacterium]|nr:DUF1778 domain-containing protein [Planctomycetota bacterium]
MTVASHNARLDVRLAPQQKDLIEQAAELSAQSLSGFVVSVLVDQARKVVDRHTTIRLSNRDRDRFLALLDNPPPPAPALRKAARRHRETLAK